MIPRPALRTILLHAGIGFALATLFLAALYLGDPGGIADLLRHAEGHPWPTLLLWFFCGLTFGAVQLAMTVMNDDGPDDDDDYGGRLVPIPVRARRR